MTVENGAPAGAAAGTETAGTETVTATIAAADAGDVSSFLDADRAARQGKPLAPVERPKIVAKDGKPVTGRNGEPAKGPKPADAAADERLTARVREAVDTATADARREIAELKARIPAAKVEAPKVETKTAAAAAVEDFKRIAALPDAPKAEDFETTTEHAAALSSFVNETRSAERAAATRDTEAQVGRERASIERVKTFHGRINDYKATDAGKEFAAKLTPEVRALHGYARLQSDNMARTTRGESPLPATVDHAIAEELYDSEAPGQMAVYLSEHPDDLAALRACPNPPAVIKLFTRLESKALGTTAPASAGTEEPQTDAAVRASADAAIDRSVTKAKPPAPKVGKAGSSVDPLAKALEDGDVGMFLELDRQARAEKRGLSAR